MSSLRKHTPALLALAALSITAAASVATFEGTADAAVDPTFTFAVLPDTQLETKVAGDPRFRNRTTWLVNNRTALDLRFALHSGDLVDWDTADHAQNQVAAGAMKVLQDAGLHYSIAPGNHDTAAVCPGGAACDATRTKTLVRDTKTFNAYNTTATFGAVSEVFEAGKVDNAFSTYSAGGLQWGVLNLELWPRTTVIDWARRVVAAHPKHNIIVVTHSYLNDDGTISTSPGYGQNSPQYLFDRLISQYPNVKFVFSGHTGVEAARQDTGVNGNRIYSFLGAFHDGTTNPVRLVEVDTAANTISSRIYAPYTNTSYPQYDHQITGVSWAR